MGTSDYPREREASPEMMKISALVTRPPKQKPSSEYNFLIVCKFLWRNDIKNLLFRNFYALFKFKM